MTGTREWWVEPLPRRGYARKPHLYVNGSDVSFCLKGHRRKGDLQFDPATARTLENDPRLGRPQMRRECGTCRNDAVASGYIS